MKRSSHLSYPLYPSLVLSLVLALIPSARAGADEGPDSPLTVSGVVVDGTGAPLEGLQVVLTAARVSLSIKPFGRVPRKISERTVLTDGSGEFALQWPWKRGYNNFELVVGVPYRDGRTDRLHVLEKRDLTKRVKASRTVVVMIDIQDTSFVEERERFLATFTSADQHRVYEEMGQPQRVDSVHTGERTEVTWWYFKHGRLYRFADGELIEEKDFKAVEPL
jgi:hypothetical protein